MLAPHLPELGQQDVCLEECQQTVTAGGLVRHTEHAMVRALCVRRQPKVWCISVYCTVGWCTLVLEPSCVQEWEDTAKCEA